MRFFTKSLLAAALCTFGYNANSQFQYHQEGGVSLFVSPSAFCPVGTYWARLNVYQLNDEVAFSASAIPSLGGYFNSQTGGYLGVDLPVTIDANIGNRATDDSGSSFGGFAGLGYGFNLMVGNGSSKSHGVLFQAGIRTEFEFRGVDRRLTLRASYLLGSGEVDPLTDESPNPSVIGVGLLYGLGY